jgi:hypothetical protein
LALLAGFGTVAVLRSRSVAPRLFPRVAVLLPVLWSLAVNHVIYLDAAAYVSGRMTREAWLARFGEPGHGDFSFLAGARAAEYVHTHTREGDPVLVWGFEPAVYLLSGRYPPTRFFFNVPVGVHFAPEHWRREFLEDLRRRPPELFLVLRNDAIPWASGRRDDSAAQLQSWPELHQWLTKNYHHETTLEDFTLYRHHPR